MSPGSTSFISFPLYSQYLLSKIWEPSNSQFIKRLKLFSLRIRPQIVSACLCTIDWLAPEPYRSAGYAKYLHLWIKTRKRTKIKQNRKRIPKQNRTPTRNSSSWPLPESRPRGHENKSKSTVRTDIQVRIQQNERSSTRVIETSSSPYFQRDKAMW